MLVVFDFVRLRQAAVVFCLAAFLSGCSTTEFVSTPPRYSGSSAVESIYVYSFLDFNASNMGHEKLDEFRHKFTEALNQHGIRSEQLWFNESPVRYQQALKRKRSFWSASSTTELPVGEVIKTNLPAEVLFKATHRLIIFPATTVTDQLGERFGIRWDLINAHTGHLDWSTTSITRNVNLLWRGEKAESRAKLIVDSIITEMVASGVIRP